MFSVIALGRIADKQATEALVPLLENPELRIRGTAAAALGRIGDERATGALLRVIENDRENQWVRDAAAWALWRLEDEGLAGPILRYLKAYHGDVVGPGVDFDADPSGKDSNGGSAEQ